MNIIIGPLNQPTQALTPANDMAQRIHPATNVSQFLPPMLVRRLQLAAVAGDISAIDLLTLEAHRDYPELVRHPEDESKFGESKAAEVAA